MWDVSEWIDKMNAFDYNYMSLDYPVFIKNILFLLRRWCDTSQQRLNTFPGPEASYDWSTQMIGRYWFWDPVLLQNEIGIWQKICSGRPGSAFRNFAFLAFSEGTHKLRKFYADHLITQKFKGPILTFFHSFRGTSGERGLWDNCLYRLQVETAQITVADSREDMRSSSLNVNIK